jgi:transposase InsO family protein
VSGGVDYGDLGISAVIDRLRTTQGSDRSLDGLVWLHVGLDYPEVRGEFPPIGPAHRVNGRTMEQGMSLGLHGVERAFLVPPLTTDIGASYALLSIWFPSAIVDLRTGGGEKLHRATLTDPLAGCHFGLSMASGAAALCAALLAASVSIQRPDFPGLRTAP